MFRIFCEQLLFTGPAWFFSVALQTHARVLLEEHIGSIFLSISAPYTKVKCDPSFFHGAM
jgi:hypothetical protein